MQKRILSALFYEKENCCDLLNCVQPVTERAWMYIYVEKSSTYNNFNKLEQRSYMIKGLVQHTAHRFSAVPSPF